MSTAKPDWADLPPELWRGVLEQARLEQATGPQGTGGGGSLGAVVQAALHNRRNKQGTTCGGAWAWL